MESPTGVTVHQTSPCVEAPLQEGGAGGGQHVGHVPRTETLPPRHSISTIVRASASRASAPAATSGAPYTAVSTPASLLTGYLTVTVTCVPTPAPTPTRVCATPAPAPPDCVTPAPLTPLWTVDPSLHTVTAPLIAGGATGGAGGTGGAAGIPGTEERSHRCTRNRTMTLKR